ncbi:MAG: tail fiber protein [Clostridia bacterium]|nr:tail fiber protein [Clostridia bacterium]
MIDTKGITLIALIITIIVLLILAGISINSLLGENGVIKKAENSKEQYEEAKSNEEKKLDDLYSTIMIATNDSSQITISTEDLKELIKQEVQNASGVPTGTIISYMGNSAPNGYLSCDGKVYNISEYSSLAEQKKNEFGSYNYYGGDGESTFAVPNLEGEFLIGINKNETSGVHQDEGLPNIEGTLGALANGSIPSNISLSLATGAFSSVVRPGFRDGYTTGSNTNPTYYAKYDASKSNSIYGNSNHVTPSNTSVLYCIKY